MRFRKRPPATIADFDATPMADVTMLLIIFFILATSFVRILHAPMKLPRERGEAPEAMERVIVDVLGEGRYALDGLEQPLEQLARDAAARLKETATARLIVRADREETVRDLNRLALRLAEAGVRTWTLATTGESGGGVGGVGGLGGGP